MYVNEDYKEIINRILQGYEIGLMGSASLADPRKRNLTTLKEKKEKKSKLRWEGGEALGKTVRRKNKRFI